MQTFFLYQLSGTASTENYEDRERATPFPAWFVTASAAWSQRAYAARARGPGSEQGSCLLRPAQMMKDAASVPHRPPAARAAMCLRAEKGPSPLLSSPLIRGGETQVST